MDGISNTHHSFTDVGINNLEIGVSLYRHLGMEPGEETLPQNSSKLAEISEFLDNHPDGASVIGRVIRSNKSPNIKNIDHLWSYVQLNKQKMGLLSQIDKLNSDLKYYD